MDFMAYDFLGSEFLWNLTTPPSIHSPHFSLIFRKLMRYFVHRFANHGTREITLILKERKKWKKIDDIRCLVALISLAKLK